MVSKDILLEGLNQPHPYLAWAFIYCHSICMQALKALVSHGCTGLSEPWLLPEAINTKILHLLAHFIWWGWGVGLGGRKKIIICKKN